MAAGALSCARRALGPILWTAPLHFASVCLVSQLGPIPDAHQPSKRALWVAGLINPPARQGVTTTDRLAVEVRQSVMRGRTAEVRISVVERALDSSIQRLRRLAGGDEKFSP